MVSEVFLRGEEKLTDKPDVLELTQSSKFKARSAGTMASELLVTTESVSQRGSVGTNNDFTK